MNEIEVPQESRAEEQEALASAGVLDAKAASSSYLPANIDALTRAVVALEKGGWSFLQSGVGSTLFEFGKGLG